MTDSGVTKSVFKGVLGAVGVIVLVVVVAAVVFFGFMRNDAQSQREQFSEISSQLG